MHVGEFSTRLRNSLRQTLSANIHDKGLRMSGPWGMFFDENSAWGQTGKLDRHLYLELSGRFHDNVVREILLAAADFKVSRTSLCDQDISVLRSIAERYGFEIVSSNSRWVLCPDFGKGGWANRMQRVSEPDDLHGVRNVYVASSSALAETAKMLDQAGEDDLFGALLGIPACCRAAFDKFKLPAAQRQFDLTPYVLENTDGPMPYDWRMNYLTQHFGRSLLSFFPCSFRCQAALKIADKTITLLNRCHADWARTFEDLQKSTILFTENNGLHLFRAPLCKGTISYRGPDLQSSEDTDLAALLRKGNFVELFGSNSVRVYRDSTVAGELSGVDARMCGFCSCGTCTL